MIGDWMVLVTREGMGEAEGDLRVRLFQTYCRLLLDDVRVGIVGGMGDILAAQVRASKVVSL